MFARVTSLVFALILPPSLKAQSGSCITPGVESAAQLDQIRGVLTRADSATIAMRTELGLVGIDTAAMELVTVDSVCAQVDSAFLKRSSTQVLPSLAVYRLGPTRYAAFPAGNEQRPVFFIDDAYRVLGVILDPK